MYRKLFWVALGAFAIGTESLVVAGILPKLAHDLGVSIPQAGQLVTAFSLTYAITSPLLAVALAAQRRESILRIAMGGFALANVAAALVPGYGWLMAARMLLAAFAGLFMATAGAYAAAAVPPEQRGRAMAFVYMGLTVATVIGVPLGTMVGNSIGWRATFIGVGVLAAVAFAGLCLPREPQPAQPVVSLSQRLAIARRPDILLTLLTTMACLAGAFSIYTYLSPLLRHVGDFGDSAVAAVLMMFGFGGAAGNMLGGHLADRFGPLRVTRGALVGVMLLFSLMSVAATWGTPPWNAVLLLAAIAGWGVTGWSFPPAQQLNLVQRAPQFAPVVLSLNASAIYFGISLGAVLGSVAVAHGHVEAVGWVAAGCEVVALGLSAAVTRRRASANLAGAAG